MTVHRRVPFSTIPVGTVGVDTPANGGSRTIAREGCAATVESTYTKGQTMLYALDIETTGLSPLESKMVSVAVAAAGESMVFVSENEQSLFTDLTAWFTNPKRPRGVIVTWNGSGFDWPYMLTRAKTLGATEFLDALSIKPSAERAPVYKPIDGHEGGYAVGFAGYDHADIMRPWKPWSQDRGISNSLKAVAKANAIDVIEVDRTKIDSLSRAELVAYNISDVAATLTLAERLGTNINPWLDSTLT